MHGYMVYESWPDAMSVIMASKSYAQTASVYFTPAQLADSNISGWTADPDLDDASNGQEYFQGTSPLSGDGKQVGAATFVTSDARTPLYRDLAFLQKRAISSRNPPI